MKKNLKAAQRRQNQTIFAVEDDPSVRRLLGEILKFKGYRCRLLQSAAELRKAAAKSAPSAVVCEAHLPDGSGIDACLELRRRWPRLSAILISWSARSIERAREKGFENVLLKPFKIEELVSALGKLPVHSASRRNSGY